MQSWDYPLANLESLTLAADVRFDEVSYCNDHIWELKVSDGLPAGLMLSTTYGLRARRYQMFPQFGEEKTALSDPAAFSRPVLLKGAYPNFCQLTFSPFPQLDVEAEYWVPTSQTVCGRFRLINRAQVARQIRVELVALLMPLEVPNDPGHRMAAAQIQRGWALAGKTAGLAPVVCMQGGAEVENVPYPALSLSAELLPGTYRDWTWAQASLPTQEESYKLARSILNRNWEAERARVQMGNVGQVEIQTGNPDWDVVFALSQQIALGLFSRSALPGTAPAPLPNPSFVRTRQPDQGYSLRGDGSDYGAAWSGQTPLEAGYLAEIITPAAPELVKGVLLNFFATQDANTGFIDYKPGMAGQRTRTLATPFLASLVWKYYQVSGDRQFLETCFPALGRFLDAWFCEHDQDGDGVPEWDNLIQFDFPNHPVFSRQESAAQGASIASVESPALCAFLYRECQLVLQMARTLGKPAPRLRSCANSTQISLEEAAATLKETVQATWDDSRATCLCRDRDSHNHPHSRLVLKHTGTGKLAVRQSFTEAARLVLRVDTALEKTQRPQVTISGVDAAGKPCREEIAVYQWQWLLLKTGRVTSQRVYQKVEEICIENLNEEDTLTVTTLAYPYEDLSLLLPLWAEMLDETQARLLVQQTITNPQKYGQKFGLPRYAAHSQVGEGLAAACGQPPGAEIQPPGEISLPWNALIGQAMLAYGFRQEAAQLVSRLMDGLGNSLKENKCLRAAYNAQDGQGMGERNALSGLAPLGFFLDTLGVTLYSPWRVGLTGTNPFPTPVRIEYRGLRIFREGAKTTITFPDEQIFEVSDPSPCVISLED